jgi:hypothetical protein
VYLFLKQLFGTLSQLFYSSDNTYCCTIAILAEVGTSNIDQ